MGEYIDHAGNRAKRSQKIKYAGEKPDVFAERDLNVGVESACERDTAARDGETGDEQNHCDCAANKCQRRGRPESCRNRRGNHENSSTDGRADDVRGESGNSDAADKLMIDLLRSLDRRCLVSHGRGWCAMTARETRPTIRHIPDRRPRCPPAPQPGWLCYNSAVILLWTFSKAACAA